MMIKKSLKDEKKKIKNSENNFIFPSFHNNDPSKTIILDTLGGDFLPYTAIKAGIKFAFNYPSFNLLILTNQESKEKLTSNISLPDNINFKIFEEYIKQDDLPLSFRFKKNASLIKGIDYLKAKEAAGLVSAANSGTYALYSYLQLKINNDVSPVFLGLLPSSKFKNPRLFFDLGASPFLIPKKLVYHLDFCVKFCQTIFNVEEPKIVILANGTEENKGIEYISELTSEIEKKYSQNYQGKIEGSKMLLTNADIIICEGWTGNISLKSLEGGVTGFLNYLKTNIKKQSIFVKLGLFLVKPFLKKSVLHFTPAGACLLGLKEICIKIHGSSREDSIYQGLISSLQFIQTKAETNSSSID